jgi:uncharacterized protein YqeY
MNAPASTLKDRITDDMKSAMRARETLRLGAIRMLLAAIKQREVDERITLDSLAEADAQELRTWLLSRSRAAATTSRRRTSHRRRA